MPASKSTTSGLQSHHISTVLLPLLMPIFAAQVIIYEATFTGYSAATLLATQSAKANPSVFSRAGTVPRRMKIGSCGLHCKVP